MALTRTTLASACGASDTSIVIASATGMSAGLMILIDNEVFFSTRAYVAASTTVPVIRAQQGGKAYAHPSTAGVVFGPVSDFASQFAQSPAQYLIAGRPREFVSYSATGTMALPSPGADLFVELNGTSVITLTIPVPTKEMDGCILTIVGNGAAAHALTFTGGLSGAGSNYDVITVNATAPIAFQAIAMNSVWVGLCGIPIAGTVTNVTGSIA